MTKLSRLNFILLQWFWIRLALMASDGKFRGICFVYPVIPLTGFITKVIHPLGVLRHVSLVSINEKNELGQ